MKVEVLCACGRSFLNVNDVCVALEGTVCYDMDIIKASNLTEHIPFSPYIWTVEMLEAARDKILKVDRDVMDQIEKELKTKIEKSFDLKVYQYGC